MVVETGGSYTQIAASYPAVTRAAAPYEISEISDDCHSVFIDLTKMLLWIALATNRLGISPIIAKGCHRELHHTFQQTWWVYKRWQFIVVRQLLSRANTSSKPHKVASNNTFNQWCIAATYRMPSLLYISVGPLCVSWIKWKQTTSCITEPRRGTRYDGQDIFYDGYIANSHNFHYGWKLSSLCLFFRCD